MWEWIKRLFGLKPKEDKRSDPEDADVYKFVDEITKEFDAEGTHFQVLKGGGRPSDVAKETKVKNKIKAGITYWIDVYDGPKGHGFVVNFETERSGKAIRKSVNFGPEDYREQDWYEVQTL